VDPPASAAAATMKLIQDQLAEERATKSSLESRANTVITSAGTLTTLLFALGALVTKSTNYEVPGLTRVLLVLAVACFLVAIVFALNAAAPASYAEVELESLEAIATEQAFSAPATEAEPKIAKALVRVISRAREGNATKALNLKRAVKAELAAAVVLACAVAGALFA
jgi:hypothetical protein